MNESDCQARLEDLEALCAQWTRQVSAYPEPSRTESQAVLDEWRARYRGNLNLEGALRSIDALPDLERAPTLRLMGFMVGLAEATVADNSEADACGGDAPVQE